MNLWVHISSFLVFVTLLLSVTLVEATLEKDYMVEWVLLIPLSHESETGNTASLYETKKDNDSVLIKRRDVIGDTIVYVMRGKDAKISSLLAERGIDYEAFTKNYMITMGPGDVKTTMAADVINSPSIKPKTMIKSRVKRIADNNNENDVSFSTQFDRPKNTGTLRGHAVDYECRSAPFTFDVGYESNHMSWGLDRIDQRSPILDRQACFFTKTTALTSEEMIDVYVIDTGVANDPSFIYPVSYDYSYYDIGGKHDGDCNGHGTHVAGLISSSVYGVSPKNVQIHSIKALDCRGKGDFASLTAALLWIKQHRSPTRRAIINMSLGSNGGYSSSINNLINTMWEEEGVFFVSSAGNYGSNDCSVFPARLDSVISVGASTENDRRALFSNHGACVDVFSPGVSIVSCNSVNDTVGKVLSGTSASAPLVTGALANWLYLHDLDTSSTTIRKSFYEHFSRNKLDSSSISDDTLNQLVYVGVMSDTWTKTAMYIESSSLNDGTTSGSIIDRDIRPIICVVIPFMIVYHFL